MPQSLAFSLLHVIFSTKERYPFLVSPHRENMHGYLASIARNHDCECYHVGGVADHVHLAIRISRTITIAKLIEELKVQSSKWIKQQSPSMQKFSWQRGYAVFSVSPSDLPKLAKYIIEQEDHHRTKTFQEEYRAFMKKYGIDYDEKYVWD